MNDYVKLRDGTMFDVSDVIDFAPADNAFIRKCLPTTLLKMHGSPMSAKAFNQKALAAGLLVEGSRPSSKHPGERRAFLMLSPAGLKFGGVNVEDEHGNVTARWSADTVGAVLKLIGKA
jgi:hypothetical protein